MRRLLVFLDDSNLWIGGKQLSAMSLADMTKGQADKRYRIDFGRLIEHVQYKNGQMGNHFDEICGFLYGSWPPENDSMWKSAKKKGFKVFLRSLSWLWFFCFWSDFS